MTTTSTEIAGSHCEQCGSTDRDDIETRDGHIASYSQCCNERITAPWTTTGTCHLYCAHK